MMAIEKDDNDNEIEVEEANFIEDSRHIDFDMQKCLLSILNIGIPKRENEHGGSH